MTPVKLCEICGVVDISDRKGVAKYCFPCSKMRNTKETLERRNKRIKEGRVASNAGKSKLVQHPTRRCLRCEGFIVVAEELLETARLCNPCRVRNFAAGDAGMEAH